MKQWAKDQIAAATRSPAPARAPRSPRRTAPAAGGLVGCITPGCDFPLTTSTTVMDKHCDAAGHQRYEPVEVPCPECGGGAERIPGSRNRYVTDHTLDCSRFR